MRHATHVHDTLSKHCCGWCDFYDFREQTFQRHFKLQSSFSRNSARINACESIDYIHGLLNFSFLWKETCIVTRVFQLPVISPPPNFHFPAKYSTSTNTKFLYTLDTNIYSRDSWGFTDRNLRIWSSLHDIFQSIPLNAAMAEEGRGRKWGNISFQRRKIILLKKEIRLRYQRHRTL